MNSIRRNTENLPYRLEYSIVALDAFRTGDTEFGEKRFQEVLPEIRNGKYSMIVAVDDFATDLILQHSGEWPGTIPVVFAGYECSTVEMKKKYPNITGVTQDCDIEKTVRKGLDFFPETGKLIVLYDSSKASVEFANRAKNIMRNFPKIRTEYINGNEHPVNELFSILRKEEKTSLILVCPWRGLNNNDYQNAVSFGLDLAKNNKKPYLTVTDTLIGFGALGGYGTVADEDGKAAAELIRLVLEKNSAVEIPVRKGEVHPIFDYRQLAANALDVSKLPEEAILINLPPSIWERYRREIAFGGGLLFLLFSGTCLYLFLMGRAMKRTQELLRVLPGEIVVAGRDESILFRKGNSCTEEGTPRSLKELSGFDYGKCAAAVRRVFQTGSPETLEYAAEGVHRAVSMALVPNRIFGQDAVVWFSLDNTELQQARARAEEYAAKLKRSTRLWDLVINALPLHVFAKNPDNGYKYVFCNKAMADFFGKTEQTIIGMDDFDLFEQEPAEEIRTLDRALMDGSGTVPEQTIVTEDGTGKQRSLRGIKKAFAEEDGSRLLVGIAIDITEIETLKRTSEENAEWFRRTLNSIGDGVITTDADGRIVMINPVAERMLECDREKVIGLPHESVFHIERYDDGMPAPSPVTRTLRTGTIVELANHTDLISGSGKRYHISDSAAPIFGKDRKIIGAILVFRDVTEEYIRRDTLRHTVALMEAGAEVTNSATFIYDVSTKRMSGSKLLPTLWPIHDGVSGDLSEWVLPEDRQKLIDAWRAIVNATSDSILVDYRVKKDGEVRFCRLKSYVEERKHGVLKTFGVIQDITEIASAARNLEENTELWEQVINLLPVMICVKDVDDDLRYKLCNRSFAAFFGCTPEEINGKTDLDLLNRWDAERIRMYDRQAEKKGSPMNYHETVTDLEGRKIHFSTIKQVVSIGEKKLLLAAASDVSDLTNRIMTEQLNSRILSMAVREEDFDAILESIGKAVLNRMQCDRVVFSRFDGDAGFLIEKEWRALGIPPIAEDLDSHYRIWGNNARCLHGTGIVNISDAQNDPFTEELRKNPAFKAGAMLISPVFTGEKLWGTLFATHIKTNRVFSEIDENLMKSCSSVIALAEIRNRQTKALQSSDFEKQTILNNIRIPIWLFDGKGHLIRANNEVRKISGDGKGDSNLDWFEALPENDHPVVKVMRTEKAAVEKVHFDGRDFIVNAEPVFDSFGKLVYIVKSAFDVTELNTLVRQQSLSQFCLEVFFREDDMEKALHSVMEKVCDYMNASRIFMIQTDSVHNRYGVCLEYSSRGKPPVFTLQGCAFDPEKPWFRRISEDRMVEVFDLTSPEGRETVGEWHTLMTEAGIRSVYSIVLYCGNALWGNFGVMFEDEPKALTPSGKNFLKTVARQVNLLLQKQASKQALLKALEDTRRSERSNEMMLKSEKTLNYCLQTLFKETGDTEKAIHSVLRAILEHFGASRSYILRVNLEDGTQCILHEEVTPGRELSGWKGRIRPLSKESPWFRNLRTSPTLLIPDFESGGAREFSESPEKELGKIPIKSMFLARVLLDGAIWGEIGILYEEKLCSHFSDADTELLTAAARLIEVMLQRQKSRDEIVSAMEQAQAADKAKSYFLASVSHEIRTPLNAVLGFSELLRNGGVPEETAKEYLESIALSGNALLQLINDVLDLSKLEANQMEIVTEPVDFGELVRQIIKVFAYRAEARGVELTMEKMDFPPLMLDAMRIRQILFNLIGNAVKFTMKGSITVSGFFVPGENGTGEFRFSVRDTGIGISEEDQHRLMEPFVQLSQMRGTNASNNGTGLGLAISKRLAERMGGTLRLESRLGEGSVFEAVLPNIAAACGQKRKDFGMTGPSAAQPSAAAEKKSSVLLVDDVPMNLKVLTALCRRAGVSDIAAAGGGREALELLKRRKYSLVLTDMWMPDMNGEDLLKEIRSNAALKEIPVVAVTADVEIRDNFSVDKFSGILFKPVTLEKLREMLKRISGGNLD